MPNHYPFHYELRLKLLVLDSNNNVRIESSSEKFEGENPLENRNKAFEVFDEYISSLKSNNRLIKNKQGNYVITKPSLKFNINTLVEPDNIDYSSFQQEISVLLVIDDDVVTKSLLLEDYAVITIDCGDETIEIIKNEFEIHKVASYEVEPQELIDNLELIELELYEFYSIDIDSLKEIAYHYGVDYGESGEDVESGAQRTILPTPFIWNTIDDYIPNDFSPVEDSKLDIKSIIKNGESNTLEFKSSLLYSFNTNQNENYVRYIIAKSICGFLNSNGGVLLIGIRDNGVIQGLSYDYSLFKDTDNPKDNLLLELDALITVYFGKSIMPYITTRIIRVDGKDIMIVMVEESRKPVFLIKKTTDKTYKEFYIRMNASTRQIYDLEDITEYVFNKK